MPIGGKDAFLSKVTFRRESNWYSKTKQELIDMDTVTMIDVVLTIQRMEERGIFVKDHAIEDAIGLVKFNHIIDNEIMMTKKLGE